ncbi:MAG: hypothetical protein IPK82_23495 [Polyangiaceae bacterium]|nr:hypothetical protein [Polyangiaceae bacterium]
MANVETIWLSAYKAKVPQSYRWQSFMLGEAARRKLQRIRHRVGALDSTAKRQLEHLGHDRRHNRPRNRLRGRDRAHQRAALFHLARAIWFSGVVDGGAANAGELPAHPTTGNGCKTSTAPSPTI